MRNTYEHNMTAQALALREARGELAFSQALLAEFDGKKPRHKTRVIVERVSAADVRETGSPERALADLKLAYSVSSTSEEAKNIGIKTRYSLIEMDCERRGPVFVKKSSVVYWGVNELGDVTRRRIEFRKGGKTK